MPKFNVVCNKYGKTFSGNSEYDSEMEYNDHECIENSSSLHILTASELNQIIIGEKTEEEIWQEKENSLKKGPYNNPTG